MVRQRGLLRRRLIDHLRVLDDVDVGAPTGRARHQRHLAILNAGEHHHTFTQLVLELIGGFHQRLAIGDVVVLADTGAPAAGIASETAHAGCLSFEMSSGVNRYIVNAGAPVFRDPDHVAFSRMTAAHSTVAINDTSSLRFSQSSFLGPIVTGGVSKVDVESLDEAGKHQGFSATHNGYVGQMKLLHSRKIRLLASGHELQGRDLFLGPDRNPPSPDNSAIAVARFHVHPSIMVHWDEDGAVRLTAADGECWRFLARDLRPEIEEDVHFADLAGARASKQITLTFRVGETPEIAWKLVRTVLPRARD